MKRLQPPVLVVARTVEEKKRKSFRVIDGDGVSISRRHEHTGAHRPDDSQFRHFGDPFSGGRLMGASSSKSRSDCSLRNPKWFATDREREFHDRASTLVGPRRIVPFSEPGGELLFS